MLRIHGLSEEKTEIAYPKVFNSLMQQEKKASK